MRLVSSAGAAPLRPYRWLPALSIAALCLCPAAAQEAVRGRTANPHGALNTRCENCHTTTAWKPIRKQVEFDHDRQTSFPLLGLHQAVPCQSCHASLVFSKTPTRCADCHADLHRRQFGSDCQSCHTVRGWNVAVSAVQQHNNRFPLIGAHAAATCDACHHGAAAGVYTGLSTQCVSCHLQDFQQGAPLNHLAAKLPTTCENCHGMNTWTTARFDHTQFTTFALTGAHAAVPCAQCHVGGRFAGTPANCAGCHMPDYMHTTNPNHAAANFPTVCETCHVTSSWQDARFDHSLSIFPLTGAHATVPCAQCHANGVFTTAPTQCVGCHLADFQKTSSPNHVTAGISQDCSSCHNTTQWTVAAFNHATTGFTLTGAHTSLQCAQCHVNNNYSLTSGACINCHLSDFNTAANPNHQSGGFPQDCTICHNTTQWMGATFNHSTTGFALTGAHASTQCAQCHTNNNYGLTSGACINCHLTDFNNTNNPPHKAAGLSQDCSTCHNTMNWDGATFNHMTTGFALVGVHATQQCAACHVNNNYNLTSGTCLNCHLTDFSTANSPPHQSAGFPQDCTLCHGSSAINWTSATFNHVTTGFTLTGAHINLQCAQCHTNNNYNLTSGACINCHLTDFNNTNNPPHKASGFAQDCSGCHTTTSWDGATFNHATTGYPLVGLHVVQPCAACHVNNNYNLTSTACWSCHQADYNSANSPPHKGFSQDCTTCHGAAILNWTNSTFDHSTTGFALVGVHATQQCAACHVDNNYTLTSTACIGCHQTDFNGANNPPHQGFPQDCTLCHGTSALNWTSATFNHASTGFALVGTHATQQCVACHVNNNYSLSSTACITCHLTDYNNANNPPHKAGGFPQDCTPCHGSSAVNWTSATFNHASTGFALTGAHTSLQCAQCHVNNNYTLTSGACINCHLTDYNNTNNPPHKSANFPQDCSGCHTTTNWDGATFNHATTGFALVGTHASQQCAACHVNNNYTLTGTACWTCHQADFNSANNPPHQSAGFPQDCTVCHGTAITNWTSATFNHNTTGFTLTGAHTSLQCAQCHVNNNYSLTSGACINCHLTDYNNTNNPPHKSANFPQDCLGCHTTTNWNGATFNHASTGFTLVGTHATQQCAACHVNNNYSLTSTACWSCHQVDYNNANNPPHQAAGFPQDCTLCHGSAITNWTSATFNHTTTGFTLTGAHLNLQCAQCHVNNNYSLTSGACWSCHQTDYNNTNNPPHRSAGFPQDCSGCHTTTDWTGATFNHATTGFTLTGAHTSLQCAQCHVNNNFSLTSAACWNCHQTDYNGTTNPPHQTAGFPQDCSMCHSTTNWSGATFNHPTTPLALTGFHATMLANNQCVQCHVGNNYTSTPSDCYSCHKLDYQNTTNPNHASSGFPTTCNTCHTSVDWTGAQFTAHDSSYFPIYSGTHNGKWTSCADCHTNSSDFSVFTCIACHQHSNQARVTSDHQGIKGFVYTPTSCYTCHPRGSGG